MSDELRLVLRGSEWLRGEGGEMSMLLRPSDGKRCCLGVYARELGVPDEHVASCGDFDDMRHRRGTVIDLPSWVFSTGCINPLNSDVDEAIRVNDNQQLTDAERVKQLTAIFARHGVVVEFSPDE